MTSRNHNSWKRIAAVAALMACAMLPALAQSPSSFKEKDPGTQNKLPTILSKVSVAQHLGTQLPLDATFTDETGKTVKLGDYFGKVPVILSLVYYQCPMLCSEELNGLTSALMMVHYKPGEDFNVVVVSIDPTETPALAAAKKATYVKRYGHPESANGWHFLTGDQANIDRLSEAVGFNYTKVPGPDGKLTQYAHASAIEIATPKGELAQYFYGVEYSPKDILFAISQASNNRLGSPVVALVLYCYHYDPSTGKYTLLIVRVLQLACMVTVLLVGGFLIWNFRRDAKSKMRTNG